MKTVKQQANLAGKLRTKLRKNIVVTTAVLMALSSTITSAAEKVSGSGIAGSPEMLELGTKWQVMNNSPAKQKGRELFNQNKYGMFIHWGLYSQLGGIYQGKKMEDGGTGPRVAEWVMRRKEIPRAEYAKLAETFNPTKFDADEWVAIAKAAGMKYMVITSKHHDGFALFDSKVTDFDVIDATPFGRDIIRELEVACKKAGLSFGVYYSNALDWRDGGDSGMKDYGPAKNPQQKQFVNRFDPSPASFDEYIANKSLPQVRELVSNYDLSQVWMDTPIYIPAKYSFEFYKTLYNANPEILVNQRIGNGFGDIGTPGDNVIPDTASANTWEGIATTNNSWGFKSYDKDWKSPIETLYWLVANVSKGGNFLLNVGPDGTGTIPAKSVENLAAVGKWLKVNGDAIYGTKPWIVDHEGPTNLQMKGTGHRSKKKFTFEFSQDDFWFTEKADSVYAIALARADNNKALIQAFKGKKVKDVRLVGTNNLLKWTNDAKGLAVELPSFSDNGIGYALQIKL